MWQKVDDEMYELTIGEFVLLLELDESSLSMFHSYATYHCGLWVQDDSEDTSVMLSEFTVTTLSLELAQKEAVKVAIDLLQQKIDEFSKFL